MSERALLNTIICQLRKLNQRICENGEENVPFDGQLTQGGEVVSDTNPLPVEISEENFPGLTDAELRAQPIDINELQRNIDEVIISPELPYTIAGGQFFDYTIITFGDVSIGGTVVPEGEYHYGGNPNDILINGKEITGTGSVIIMTQENLT